MAKKIQTFGWLIGWWIWLVSYYPALATTPCVDLIQQDDFWGKNKQSILHIDIKSWAQYTKKVIKQHWAIGSEVAIGPVLEWRPLNGIGLQTGLCYSYNCFFTINFSVDREELLDPSPFKFGYRFMDKIHALSAKHEGYTAHAALGNIQFHAISLPLFFRFYPEKSRKLVCYGGPRLIWILPSLRKKQYCPVYIDTSSIKNILYDGLITGKDIANQRSLTFQDIKNITEQGLLKIYHSIFKVHPDSAQPQILSNRLFNWDWVLDFGLEFRGASGFIVGINGLGLVLGYGFVK